MTEKEVSENVRNRGYSKPDDVVYNVNVSLYVQEDGTIGTAVNYCDAAGELIKDPETDKPVTYVAFDNKYEASGTVEFKASKTLNGRDMIAGQFTFSVYEENDADEKVDKAVSGLTHIAVNEDGSINFPSITYTEKDFDSKKSHRTDTNEYVRYYKIKEDIPTGAVDNKDGTWTKDGYTYDGIEYNVVVTLKDKNNGKIDTGWYAYPAGTAPEKPSLLDSIVNIFTGKEANQNIAFKNEYSTEGSLDIGATKILNGKELSGDDFDFLLTGKDEDGKEYTDLKTNEKDGTVKFDTIKYTKPGEYEYTIEEVIPKDAVENVLDGITYSKDKYTVNVKVEEEDKELGNGKLKVTASIDDKVISEEVTDDGRTVTVCRPDAVSFTNEYDAKSVSVTLGGKKTLTGRSLADGEFEFVLASAGGNPKTYSEPSTNVKDTFRFPAIEFTSDDLRDSKGVIAPFREFAYTITETKGNLAGVTYDETNYDVVITVTNSNGELKASVTSNENVVGLQKDEEFYPAANFTNTYDADGELTLAVRKIVDGSKSSDKEFTFELTGDDIDKPYTTTAVNGQTAAFDKLSYKLSDLDKNDEGTYSKTYNYKVSEVDLKDNIGYTYSSEVYNIKVDVTSDGKSGVVNIDKTITAEGDTAPYTGSAMVFTNTYKAEGSTTIEGTKELTGRSLIDGEFTFILEELGDSGRFSQKAVTANSSGRFSFDLAYDQDDIGKTFVYRVSEYVPYNSGATGIDYDESVFDVTVTVEDNGNGTLKVTRTIRKRGQDVRTCDFVNSVIATPTPTPTSWKA